MSTDVEKLDWEKARDYLSRCEEAYTAIGSAGSFAMNFVITPLRDRLNSGERTEQLYNEIMEIAI